MSLCKICDLCMFSRIDDVSNTFEPFRGQTRVLRSKIDPKIYQDIAFPAQTLIYTQAPFVFPYTKVNTPPQQQLNLWLQGGRPHSALYIQRERARY